MTSLISLNCSILGPNIPDIFGVNISLNESISDLKKLIKKDLEHQLDGIDAHRLVIWKLGNPLSNEHIVATLQGVVDGEEVPKALELIPMNLLSDYFLTPPVPKMLHLIVKLPSLSPSSSNYDSMGGPDDSTKWSRRKDTVRALYQKLNCYTLMHVRGTPASGKTTLLNLLWTYIKAKEPNGVNIHLFVRWNRDGVDNVDDSTWLRQKIPGFPNPTAKTYLLFDNGECTYWDAALWDYFFKRHRDFDKYRIILFCSYGSAGSQPLRYNPGTPMNLESVAQVSLVCDDMSVDNFGKIKLLLSPNEFDEIIERRQVEFAVAPGLQKMIFSWTGGHVGAVTDVLNIIFREVRARKDELELQGEPLDLQILPKLFSFESFWEMLAQSATWTCGLPRHQLQEPEMAEIFKNLLKFGFIVDTGSSNAVQDCHQHGWIYATALTKGKMVYVLPSPLHRAYYEWKLLPSSTEYKFTTLLDMTIKVIQAFQPSQLSNPPRRVGISGAVRPPEAAYQDEFYRSIFTITKGCVRVSSEFSSAKGAGLGCIDFFIPSAKWGIELLRDGNNVEEHSSCFSTEGPYGPWLKYSDMSDFIILDFRATRVNKPHKHIEKLYHIVFLNKDFNQVEILNKDLATVAKFALMEH